MSTVKPLESGSRHDLRTGASPDAPDEDKFQDDWKGAYRLLPFLRVIIPLRRPGTARRAVRVRLPAALHLLSQSGHLAPQGRHLCFGRTRVAPAEAHLGAWLS